MLFWGGFGSDGRAVFQRSHPAVNMPNTWCLLGEELGENVRGGHAEQAGPLHAVGNASHCVIVQDYFRQVA